MADHIDPICGMQGEEQDAAGLSEYEGTTYYFDSQECMSKFNQHPERYADKSDKEELSDAPQVKEPSERNVDRINWNPIFRVGPIPINWYGVRSEMFSVAQPPADEKAEREGYLESN
jgi:YHS domain-containing protein